MPPTAERGCLLIADISGYTGYVVAGPLEYVEDVVADITSDVARRLEPILHVNKLEGDAAFGYALDGELDGSMLLDSVEECYFGFRRRLRGIEHATNCSCSACAKAPELNLKFVVHYGAFIRRPSARGEELTGPDVILVHRLLKNAAAERLGLHGYALCTQACVDALGIDPAALELRAHREVYGDVGGVNAWVLDLETRWASEQERTRVVVGPGAESFAVDLTLPIPAPVAWEYLTAPQKRLLWQVDDIEQVDAGGRRCTGTSSVCVDGRTKIYEEIVDWRPFDYFTERMTVGRGVRVLMTTSFEEDGGVTRVVSRVKHEGAGRVAWLTVGPRLRRRLEDRYARLAKLPPAHIPSDKQLPLAAPLAPPA